MLVQHYCMHQQRLPVHYAENDQHQTNDMMSWHSRHLAPYITAMHKHTDQGEQTQKDNRGAVCSLGYPDDIYPSWPDSQHSAWARPHLPLA